MNDVLGWISTVLLLLIAGFLFRLPYMLEEKVAQNRKSSDNRQLQVESYFRSISGDDQKDVFSQWALNMLDFKNSKLEPKNDYTSLIYRTVVYGSDKTTILLSNMSHCMHTLDDDPSKEDLMKLKVYQAFIVSSLKFDFAGYNVDPIILLKINISDFDDYETDYKKAAQAIRKELDDVLEERDE